MPTWDELKRQVESNDDVSTVTMEELREAAGAGKLGIHVRAQISKTLAGMGLGHVPQDLPSNQHEQVRLYKRGTAAGDLMETVLAPGESNDKKLVGYLDKEKANNAAIIAQIRELVEE